MRILRVFDRYTDSGLSYFLIERITLLNCDDYQMQVVYLDKSSGNVPDEYNGVKFSLFSDTRIGDFSIPTIIKLIKLIKREKIDILHCDNYKGLFYGMLASLFCKNVKVMCLMHGLNRCRNWRRRLFFKIFGSRIDKLIGCSQRVAEDIKKYPGIKPEQVVALSNSTNYHKHASVEADASLRTSFGFGEDDFVFINVGRIVETKGLEYLLEAFEMVSKERKNAKLLIVGEGRLKEQLQANAPDGVVFAGFRKDVTKLMKVSDSFVLSSIREGMPLVVFEAMSVGLPVVTTDTGAAEQIREQDGEKYGFLCPVADSKALAGAMKEAMDMDEDARKGLVSRAKKRIEDEYSHQRAVEDLKKLYNDVYAKKR